MPLTVPVLENWSWPWSATILHAAYLLSGMLIALNYFPQLRRAWRFPEATLVAQSLSTWTVWTACRAIAFAYGVFVIHDLVFLMVVGADMLGRLGMLGTILRAHVIVADITPFARRAPAMRAALRSRSQAAGFTMTGTRNQYDAAPR